MLDIGCGGGVLSDSMARLGTSVKGIDVVDKNIEAAAYHAWEQGLDVDYRLATASALASGGESFDVVLNMEVVEHVADLPVFMSNAATLVNDVGTMVVTTINRN